MYDPVKGDLKSELLSELRDFLGSQLEDTPLYQKCMDAPELILSEWRKQEIDPKDKDAVTRFYVETDLYCYELIGLEINMPKSRYQQLKELVDLLKRGDKLKGCDYGSGIGTLGIYLNKNGIHCDFADVSDLNLKFVKSRLARRSIAGPKLFNLLREEISSGYDFVTAFDVLEHVTDPVKLIQEISGKLKPGGYFIFNLLYHDEPNTPHLIRDPDVVRKKIRSFNLTKISSIGEFKIYKKVPRTNMMNSLIHRADSLFWDFRKGVRRLANKS